MSERPGGERPMEPNRTCSECGQRLPDDASELLCPVCALRGIAEEPVEPNPTAGHETAAPVPLTGSFGDYELIEEIARGGMGVVYKARQKSLSRLVALKMVLGGPLASAATRQRFLAEARAAANLQHPNIIAIHEVGEHEGQPFFSMDYVEGRSLAELLRGGPLPPRRAAAYGQTIAEAVHCAHQRGILHRDLKPSNVLIDHFDQPRVTDFGLAKRLTGDSDLTVSGQVLGSPNFMSPELVLGRHREVGPASDVYSLGALLYHLLTGRPPFQAATLTEVLRQVATTEPAPPRLLNASIPRDLETICLKCLEKDIPRRYPTAQALADELGRFLRGEPILARPVGLAGKAVKWCQRNPLLAGAVGLAAVSLLAGLGGVSWQWRRAEAHRAHAEAEALLARRNAYAADMREVQRALEEEDLGRARELLDRYWPAGNKEVDLRSWEWRYLWARCQSDDSFTLCRYTNAVTAVAFSPDGKWLATRREDGAVALWDAAARRLQTELSAVAFGGCEKALAFSPQKNLLAWTSEDAASDKSLVCLGSPGARDVLVSLSQPEAVRSIAFSRDSPTLATMGYSGTVRLWDLESHQLVTSLPNSTNTDTASSSPLWSKSYGQVLFSPDNCWLAIGELGRRIRLVDWKTGKEREPIAVPAPADGVAALAFSPDSRLLAAGCGGGDNDIHLWDLTTGATVARLEGHSGWVAALAFSPDGQTLASAGADQTLRLWDVTSRKEKRRFRGHTDEVWAVAWSSDGKSLVTGGKDGTVRFWNPADQEPPASVQVPGENLSWGLAFLPDSKGLLALTQAEGAVVQWDLSTMHAGQGMSFLGTNHTALDLSPDGRWLALGDERGNISVWDFTGRRLATNLVLPGCSISVLFFSPRGSLLTGANTGPGIPRGKIWSVPGWREVSVQGIKLKDGLDAAFSPDDRLFVAGYTDGTAAWWDVATRERRAFFPCHYAGGVWVACSPDGRLFATGGMVDGLLTTWDTATLTPQPFGRASRNGLQHLIFSRDSQRLVASGMSPRGVVKLWDAVIGRDVATLPGRFGFINHILFSPDGNTLLAASSQGTIELWRAPSFAEIARIENQRAGLKPAESPGERRANDVPAPAETTR